MNKVIYIIVAVLVGVVGYQAVQMQELKKELIKKQKEPEVLIHIDKVQRTKQSLQTDKNSSLDRVLKSDFQKIFKDVFGNKEVKDGINQSVTEFKKGLNQAIIQLQKQVNSMDKDSGNIFNDLIKNLGAGQFKTFVDKGKIYSYVIDVDGEHSKVNIDAKNGFLYVDISSKDEKKTKNSVVKEQSKKSIVLQLPKDGEIEKIRSEYKDKKLYITIPKIKS